jgi:hypothetical protein
VDVAKTDEFTEVRNFDRMWGDGDLICRRCGGYVRAIDTG